MSLRTAAFVALVSGSAILLAGEFWQDKQPSEWTDKDIQQLETKSPWAKEASLTFNSERMAGMGRRGGMGGMGGMGGRGGMGGPGMGRPRGEEGSRGGRSAPQLTVRWDSAAPLREAAAKGQPEDAQAKKVVEWAPQFYVVTVTGMPMRAGRGQPESDSNRAPGIEDRLKEVTVLKLKGSAGSIAPERVEVTDATGGPVVDFLFPRSEKISLDDKEVDFETLLGRREVKVKFTLKDMLYRGKLEL